jgi:hypothetical protein
MRADRADGCGGCDAEIMMKLNRRLELEKQKAQVEQF